MNTPTTDTKAKPTAGPENELPKGKWTPFTYPDGYGITGPTAAFEHRIRCAYKEKHPNNPVFESITTLVSTQSLCVAAIAVGETKEQADKIADLIAEAGTVYHETKLTPRELVERYNEAIEALKEITSAVVSGKCRTESEVEKALIVINKATE